MLDIKYIRENAEQVKKGAEAKHITCDVDGLLAVDERRRQIQQELDQLRQQFDVIIVDAPALGESLEATLLGRLVDGTVVVVDAGKNRWQAVRSGIAQIESQGGNVLGVVLNKQKHYIPNWLYRKML